MNTNEQTVFIVPVESQGKRLDAWLTQMMPDHSRNEIQRWIKDGLVLVADERLAAKKVRTSHKVEAGQEITVHVPQPSKEAVFEAESIPLDIVYEDENVILVNKPAGMVVHPAPGHERGTLVNAVLYHCPDLVGVGGERRPGLVHRLDKDTSGIIAIAKNDKAHRHLQAQFKARTVYKEYLTLVEGHIEPVKGRISAPVGRHPVDRKRQTVLPVDSLTGETKGREAITEYHTLSYHSAPATSPLIRGTNATANFTFLRVILHTGRTHQIRVHLAWHKYPVVGDTLYGYRRQRLILPRQFLHAHRLHLQLPDAKEEREFVAPLPEDLQGLLDRLS
ncbi:MAG: RluA family pseudouridine synthase [Chloroflexota bacterium]